MADCTCHPVFLNVGMRREPAGLNWEPECPQHGLQSEWWNSDENRLRRKRANRKLRAMQRLARIKRRSLCEEGS